MQNYNKDYKYPNLFYELAYFFCKIFVLFQFIV